VAELARARPQAPMTPLNRPIGPNRRYATARAGLAELKAAAKGHGATVNDGILAVVAGALRRYLADDTPRGRPVALVPVSVRQPGEEGGNRISTVLVDLPTDEPDPLARLKAIHAAMRELKGSAAVRAGALIVGASGWAPPLVSSTLARTMGDVRAFNLVVSNIPGPQQPFWTAISSRRSRRSPAPCATRWPSSVRNVKGSEPSRNRGGAARGVH
jgi:diacylglycerol O-acyltransferase / wax synthase